MTIPRWAQLFPFFVSLSILAFVLHPSAARAYAYYDTAADQLCFAYEYSGTENAFEVRYVTKMSYTQPGYKTAERRQEVMTHTRFLETRLATPPYRQGVICTSASVLRAAGVVAVVLCDQFGYMAWIGPTNFSRLLSGERLPLVIYLGKRYAGTAQAAFPAPAVPAVYVPPQAPAYAPPPVYEAPAYPPRPIVRKRVRKSIPQAQVYRKKVIIKERVEYVPYPVPVAPALPPQAGPVIPNRPCPNVYVHHC